MNSISNFFGGPRLPGFLGNIADWFQKFQLFRQNPIGAIMSMNNVNVPQNFNGTPQDLVNHLINTGQISQDQLQQFKQMADQMQNMMPRR